MATRTSAAVSSGIPAIVDKPDIERQLLVPCASHADGRPSRSLARVSSWKESLRPYRFRLSAQPPDRRGATGIQLFRPTYCAGLLAAAQKSTPASVAAGAELVTDASDTE